MRVYSASSHGVTSSRRKRIIRHFARVPFSYLLLIVSTTALLDSLDVHTRTYICSSVCMDTHMYIFFFHIATSSLI